ncbi:MAG: hypothetical protein WCV79_01110 [Candidatus Paceibacterota bacterium]
MENYNFEEFKSTSTRFSLVISLGKAQRFYLSSSFCEKYSIQKMAGVKLLYDKNKNAVGFRFVKDKEDGMIDIKNLDGNSAYINAKAFLGMYDVNTEKYINRYHPKEITNSDNQKIFVIELMENQK